MQAYTWGASRLPAYQNFVRNSLETFSGELFDCTDLALALLIRFAAANQLRLKLVHPLTGQVFDSDLGGVFVSLFEKVIRDKFGAAHLPALSFAIPIETAGRGDLVSYVRPGIHHTRLVWQTAPEPEETTFWEASLTGENEPIYPRFAFYTWSEALNERGGGAVEGLPRRWNQFR